MPNFWYYWFLTIWRRRESWNFEGIVNLYIIKVNIYTSKNYRLMLNCLLNITSNKRIVSSIKIPFYLSTQKDKKQTRYRWGFELKSQFTKKKSLEWAIFRHHNFTNVPYYRSNIHCHDFFFLSWDWRRFKCWFSEVNLEYRIALLVRYGSLYYLYLNIRPTTVAVRNKIRY